MLAATLLVPQLGAPARAAVRRLLALPAAKAGGGFLLGASLGLVFVPCAGPGARGGHRRRRQRARRPARRSCSPSPTRSAPPCPMLADRVGGRETSRRAFAARTSRPPRLGRRDRRSSRSRSSSTSTTTLPDVTPGYTRSSRSKIEENTTAQRSSRRSAARRPAQGRRAPPSRARAPSLPDYGVGAADPRRRRTGSTRRRSTLAELRGKVVLIDFWTYSCINCLRTLPHLKAWYAAYHQDGLVIIGVHTPEFAFEHVDVERRGGGQAARDHVPRRPGQRLRDLGQLLEPVLARRVPDRPDTGTIRHTEFGEGGYADDRVG